MEEDYSLSNTIEEGVLYHHPDLLEPDFQSLSCLERIVRMGKNYFGRIKEWLLEIEMGVVWGVAGVSIIIFVFAAIWFIDPALLTLVLQFRQARCSTKYSEFLVGITNCSWTSCRLGCTREVYKCWQVKVDYEFVSGTSPYAPPWSPISSFESESNAVSDVNDDEESGLARLYPNVRGCGYPPILNCDAFFEEFGPKNKTFDCWVSTMDPSIAMTELNLERAKEEVLMSLIPLFIFIVFVLYAFCRLGVFSVCNPLKVCPQANDTQIIDMPSLTPKKLFDYKKNLIAKKGGANSVELKESNSSANPVTKPPSSLQLPPSTVDRFPSAHVGFEIPATIVEAYEDPSNSSNDLEEKLRSREGSAPKSREGSGKKIEELPIFKNKRFSVASLASMTQFDTNQMFDRLEDDKDDVFDDFELGDDDIVSIRTIRTGRNRSRTAWSNGKEEEKRSTSSTSWSSGILSKSNFKKDS